MTSDENKRALDLALSLLGENNPSDALQTLDQIDGKERLSADWLVYRGLALAKLANQDEALKMFRDAELMAPYNARQNYLLAFQLQSMGLTDEAKKYAETAKEIDPKFPGLGSLLESLGMDPVSDPRMRMRERLKHPLPRPPQGPVHAFASLEQADRAWTNTGWTLGVLNIAAVALICVRLPLHAPPKGQPQGFSGLGGLVPNTDAFSVLTIGFLMAIIVLCTLWAVVDILDRRSRFEWFVPFVPFCCFLMAPGLALLLYMGLGRK